MTSPALAEHPRERLLQTASRLFYAHGVARVGINEVIREAGIARMTLYHHFPSKDALVREVLRLRVREWQEAFARAVEARAQSPRGRILAVFDALEERFSDPDFRGCSAINFASESPPDDPELAGVARAHKAFVLRYLEDLARRLPAHAPGELARGLLLIHNGATVLAQLGGDTYRPFDAKRAATRLMDAHRKPPARRRAP